MTRVDASLRIQREILRQAETTQRRMRRELISQVAALIAKRLAPVNAVEARNFLNDFRRGDLP